MNTKSNGETLRLIEENKAIDGNDISKMLTSKGI